MPDVPVGMVKVLPLLEVLVANLILIALFFWITADYDFRASYWATEVFTPTTVRYPLFLITSAVKPSTTIPGLFTLDWQQIIVLLLVVTDAVYIWSLLRPLKGSRPAEPIQATQ
jgi:hypothetical protein